MKAPDTFKFYHRFDTAHNILYTARVYPTNPNKYRISWEKRDGAVSFKRSEVEEALRDGDWLMESEPKNNKEALHLLEKN